MTNFAAKLNGFLGDHARDLAQLERMQEKLDGFSPKPGNSEFERSVPPLPEGKAACERLSCQRIVDQDELSERGWCLPCERLDLTRVQLKKERSMDGQA